MRVCGLSYLTLYVVLHFLRWTTHPSTPRGCGRPSVRGLPTCELTRSRGQVCDLPPRCFAAWGQFEKLTSPLKNKDLGAPEATRMPALAGMCRRPNLLRVALAGDQFAPLWGAIYSALRRKFLRLPLSFGHEYDLRNRCCSMGR